MKTTRFLNMMAASLVGVAFMSCSSQDDVLTPAGQTYTMSVTAQKGGDGTRALNLDGNTLNATWTEGDVVKVYNSASTELGELTAQTAGKSTTLSGTLTTLPENGATLMLKYLSPSYSQQDGTLTGSANSIDKVCDYATATVTATVSGTNVTTDAAAFQNQQAVVKFTLVDKADGTTKLSPTALTINDGTDDIVTLTDIPAETYTTNGEGVLYVAIPGFTGKTITLTATVGSDTYTCTASSKSFTNGKYYGVTAKMAKQAAAPDGAISGKFTVNADGKQVYFSKGNLQYIGSATTPYWKFAEHQYDYLGTTTGQNSDATNVDRDLFGWGTGNNPNQTSSYNAGYTFTDWGSNAISNGGNTAGSWRTLSKDEWKYVFGTNDGDKRSGATVGGTSNARYTEATINTDGTGVNGVILFPDGATFAAGEASWGTINGGSAWGTKCTTAQWTALEGKGCVFLPAAGWRSGTSVSYVGSDGYYWSSTANGSNYAYYVYFGSDNVYPANSSNRNGGRSVRLVKDVAAPAPAVPAGALNGEFSVSATKTVKFSKGNLQAKIASYASNSATASEWKFADSQYSTIGNAAGNTSFATGTWVDLFSWVGNSATNDTYGLITFTSSSQANHGNVSGESLKTDWGTAAASSIGSGWYTLSKDEWVYLFKTRTVNGGTGSGKSYTLGQSVEGKLGVVLYPDNYTGAVYSGSNWDDFESAGCVFLPAAGWRSGTSVDYVGSNCYYWSSTAAGTGNAYNVYFGSGVVNPANRSNRYLGFSVRLVRDVPSN